MIQVFELQGCNVARLVWKDLFQIAGPEGSAAIHVGGFSPGEEVVDIMEQHAGMRRWREKRERRLVSTYHTYLFIGQC